MTNHSERKHPIKIANRTHVLTRVRNLSDTNTRNILRGIFAQSDAPDAVAKAINLVRKSASPEDLGSVTELLLGKSGAFPFSNIGAKYRDLLRRHQLRPMSAENEIRFVMGHLNGWPEETIQALGSMAVLASLPEAEASDALGALYAFAQRWGASNFLAKKIAYVVATSKTDVATDATFERISEYLDQNKYSAPYFSAMECVDSNFPYFSGMKARIQLYRKYVHDDFRQLIPLHNILTSPVSVADVAAFLRKSHSMSLVDQVASVLQVLHLRAYWPSLATLVFSSATPRIASALEKACSFSFKARSLYRDTPPAEADLAFYRRSMAFVEFREPAIYRASVDRVVGRRLLPEWVDDSGPYFDLPTPTIQDLTKALHGFRYPTDYRSFQKAGTFLRTVHFLHLIEISPFSRFNYQQIRYIFEHTEALDSLMTEQELERLYATADTSSRSLISVLALALHKSRSQDDDVDFKFRFNLVDGI